MCWQRIDILKILLFVLFVNHPYARFPHELFDAHVEGVGGVPLSLLIVADGVNCAADGLGEPTLGQAQPGAHLFNVSRFHFLPLLYRGSPCG